MKHRQPRWMVVVPALGLAVACGGSTFSTAGDDGGTGEGGSSGGTSGGTGSSGASSSGGASSGSSGASGSSGGASSGASGSGSGSGSSNGGGSSGASSGGRCDGGCLDGGPSSPCPVLLPNQDAHCSPSGLVCEYGTSTVQTCDTVATCSQSSWQIQGPSSNNCGVSNPSCPTRYGLVPQGNHCGTSYGLVCDYVEGRCACTVSGGLVPLDASAVATWQCQGGSLAAGCPTRRPPLGSTCTTPNLFCDYGACYIPGGTGESCTNGLWVQAPTACPAVAGG